MIDQTLRDRDNFRKLVPFYVLDSLPESARHTVEQQILSAPELAVELAEYQLAVTAIPYGIAPMADHTQSIKQQLFKGLNLAISNVLAFSAVRADQLRWRPHSIPKLEVAILHIDRQKRERVGVMRAEPGMAYPAHQHGGTEELYMLSGDLVIGGVAYAVGDYIRSDSDSMHEPAHSVTGCMFFFRGSLDDKYPV
jgi:hypothetical protein